MKKLFYSMFALAALAMTNTSCSDELENGGINANEAAVTFTVQLENNVGSRAAGDGTQATKLQYWVYKAEADTIGTIINGLTGETTVNSDLTAEVSLTLVKGQTYNFLFWAQDPDCTCYTPVPAEGVITVNNYVGPANDESRDAFFKVRKDLKVTGPINETIVLKRPFAQINVGTSIGSLKDAQTADVTIAKSSFTVNNAATRLNTYSGSATVGNAVSYTLADIIESNKTDNAGDLKDVDGKNYEHLAMNYILVADYTDNNTTDEYGVGENKQLVDATFEIFDNTDASINKFEIPNVPVQRNWRTNIIGDILNSNVTFNIIIDPKFDNDHNYFTEEELAYAALNGGEVTLKEDVVLENHIAVKANMIVNLNGHTIEAKETNIDDESCVVFYVEEGAKLTINGEGDVKATAGSAYDMAIWAVGGEVVINGGNFENLGATDKGCDVIYAKFASVVNIYGGTFKAGNTNKESFANKTEGVWAALNLHGSATGGINVYGGKFYKFNPAVPGTEGATWNESHPSGFVADGYAIKNDGDWYEVVEYTDVLTGTGNATLYSSVKADATIAVAAGTTLDGQGNTLTMVKSLSQYALQPAGGTIKNLVVEGYNTRNEDSKVIRAIFIVSPTESVTIDNVKVSGVAYPLNTGTKGSATGMVLNVTNSELIGWSSWDGGFESASFTGCTFGVGTYFDATVAGQETWNGCIKPYVTSTFEDCAFEDGFVLDLSALKAGGTVTFKNCTVNGVALTDLSQLGATADTRVSIL